ncbi:hypothetical protein JRG49_08110 [Pseudomonas fulva]|nr:MULTISPECIES: hypothetical protein [Pseudomonas]MBN6790014.1 hypothetical protein [Pseudomonas fulva]MBN6795169.1 hypothetical protein [Pseudomonas fulva]MBN6855829.1 hypothetical protein [Pseudomonas fulva]MBN6873087.1 hypothetical protein [Pseudomonas fulva]MBN6877180.1 hypothetical protein [Pseudomonas fulva]
MDHSRLKRDQHIEIRRRVLLQPWCFDRSEAKQLLEPHPDLLGHGVSSAPLDLGQHFQQVMPLDRKDGKFAHYRQHVVIKDALDLLQRALQALLEHTTAVLESQAVHRLEGVLLCEIVGVALVGPVHTGIGIWGDQPPRFVAQ